MMKKKHYYLLYIIVAAISWGGICLATRPLGKIGLSSMQITVARLICTTVLMAILILIKDSSLFKINIRELPLFIVSGINFFGLTYFYLSSIRENQSASVAAMLLYTNPIWITILARIFFEEKITLQRIVALFGTMCGCALLLLTQEISVSVAGIIFGLLSGVCQALYSVFGKLLNKHNNAQTSTFYTFLFATLVALLFIIPSEIRNALVAKPFECAGLIVVLVVFMTIIPYTLYLKGIEVIPIGIAGIISILEPVIASLVGIIVFHDPINQWGIIGISIVILSLVKMEKQDKDAKRRIYK